MKRLISRIFLVSLLILIGLGAIDFGTVGDEWHAMYPDDAAHRTALHYCYDNNRQLDRMSAEARKDCYSKWLPLIRAWEQVREHHVGIS